VGSQSLPLEDIILPPPVGIWPPAIGWWVLSLIIVVAIVAAVWWLKHWRRDRELRQQAKTLLSDARRAYASKGDICDYCKDVNHILKRYARAREAAPSVQALSGSAWATWLNQQTREAIFTDELLGAVADGPYRPIAELDPDRLERAARQWLNRCNVTAEVHHA